MDGYFRKGSMYSLLSGEKICSQGEPGDPWQAGVGLFHLHAYDTGLPINIWCIQWQQGL